MISGKLGHFDALMNGFVFLLLGLVRFYIVEVIDVNGIRNGWFWCYLCL